MGIATIKNNLRLYHLAYLLPAVFLYRHPVALISFWIGLWILASCFHIARASMRADAVERPATAKAQRRLLTVVAVALAALCINTIRLTPPMQSPDELAHTFRAASLANGDIVLERNSRDSPSNQSIDSGLHAFAHLWGNRISGKPQNEVTTELLAESDAITFSDSTARDFNPAASYFPLAYWPAATAFALTSSTGASVAASYTTARIAMCVVGLLLLILAMGIARHGLFLIVCAAILPMTISQLASVNLDAVTIPAALLVVAMITRGVFGHAQLRLDRGATIGAWCLLSMLILAKPPFAVFLLPIVCLWVSAKKSPDRLAAAAMLALVVLLVGWIVIGVIPVNDPRVASRSSYGAGEIASAVWHTVITGVNSYLRSMIGILGWFDTKFPRWFYTVGKMFILAAMVSQVRMSRIETRKDQWIALLTAIIAVIGIHVLMMLTWNFDASRNLINGVQGRYLLPFLPLLGIILGRKIAPDQVDDNDSGQIQIFTWIAAVFAVVSGVAVQMTLNERFWPQT